MAVLVFDGSYDAYFWVLCVDKYCKVQGISEEEKMALVSTAMSGCALKWWNWWSPRHPGVSWNMFTISLLWRFKPEDRCILPIVDDEEEPDQELYPLVEQSGKSHESLNVVIEAWDMFLLSTDDVDVPPMNVVNGGNVDVSDATTNELIEKPKSLDDSILIDDCLPPHHLARFDVSDSLEDLHLDTKFDFPQFSRLFSSTFTPTTAISFNTTLLRNDTLRDELFDAPFTGSSSAKITVMLPLQFISLFDPGGTQLVTTSPLLRFRTEVVLNLVPLPWFYNLHLLLAPVNCYTAISLISDDGVFEFEISKSTEPSIRTLCDTHCVFDEMTLSGTYYFSTINCSLDFKQWDPGTIKALGSGFPITNLRFILLEDNTIVDRNDEWLHESYVGCGHTSSGKNYCLVCPWPCDGWLLLDHLSAHKPYSMLPPTGLVHHMTYKPLSKLIFLKLKVSSFIVDLNHMFVHFFVRWIPITPTLRVASTQTEMLTTFCSCYLAMDYTFYVTQFLRENCNRDHCVIMPAKVSENGYLKLIIVLNGMTFLYGYGQDKLVASGSNGSFYLETYHFFSMVKLHILTMIDDATAYAIEYVTDRGSDFFEAYVDSFYSFEMNSELPLIYYNSDIRSIGVVIYFFVTTPCAPTNCVFESAAKMDSTAMKKLKISTMLFLMGFGTRLYTGQAYTYVHEIANSFYTSNLTYVLVGLYCQIGLAPWAGCIYSITLYVRGKRIVCGFKLNFIVGVHCLISIGLLAQLKVDRVAKISMVEFVQQGREKFPNLEVADTQEYVVVICLNDTQLLSTIHYACLAAQNVVIELIERLNSLIPAHSSTYTFAKLSLLSNSLWLLRSFFRSYSPHHMIQLDFTVLVGAMGSCALFCYGFAIIFNIHNMISTSFTAAEYMQMTMKGKQSLKFDYVGTSYFFLTKKTLQFRKWDPGGCFCSLGRFVHVLKASWEVAIITQHYFSFNLEDKVDFNGGSNVMIQNGT